MKAKDALIAWTPADFRDDPSAGQVKVGPAPNEPAPEWLAMFAYTGGAAYALVRNLTGDAAKARLFIDFNTLVVRDGIDPQVAHEAFLLIDEYAESISPDIAGARMAEIGKLRGAAARG